MMKNSFLVFALVLLFGAKALAQEWEYSIERVDVECPYLYEAKPLQDGNIAVTYFAAFRSASWSSEPGLLLLSPDGEELARNSFSKPAFWGYHPRVLSDGEGTTYMLAAYNPDHDSTSANYFMNFDNPPDYSILGLYKLDERLSIVESHEYHIPVDTTDAVYTLPAFGSFNGDCGSIYVFSAFVEDASVVGGYIKKVSMEYDHPHGNDSIFFFRIGFDGTLILHVGYEMDPRNEPGGGLWSWPSILKGYNIVKAGASYYCFLNTYPINLNGSQIEKEKSPEFGNVYCLDSEFNILYKKYYRQRSGLELNYFGNATYVGSRHNTVYLSCDFIPTGMSGYTGCTLYEYGLDANKAGVLPILRYTERKKYPHSIDDIAEIKGVGIASDNSVYFAYALEEGKYGMTIERLSSDFDTLSTLYYGSGITDYDFNRILSIEITEMDDILMTFFSGKYNPVKSSTTVVRFPAESFVGIEEAHKNGLKTAIAYPNPGNGILNICTGLPNARVEVYDATGRLIHAQDVTENGTVINAEAWPSGMYVWKVYSNDKEAESDKWVKK
jgi:hypothetical protein